MQRQDIRDKRAGDKMTGKDSWKNTTRTGQPEKERQTGQPARKVRMVEVGQERAEGTARTRQQRQDMYRRESNLAISSSPVTKIMYRFYWRTAIKEKKRNFLQCAGSQRDDPSRVSC